MVRVFGTVVDTDTERGITTLKFKIPAFAKGTARRRAVRNANVKGFNDVEVKELQVFEEGDLPGQIIYLVELEAS